MSNDNAFFDGPSRLPFRSFCHLLRFLDTNSQIFTPIGATTVNLVYDVLLPRFDGRVLKAEEKSITRTTFSASTHTWASASERANTTASSRIVRKQERSYQTRPSRRILHVHSSPSSFSVSRSIL